MVLFQNCVRQSRSPTKMADTVQLRCYWKQLWSRWAITGSWEPLVFIGDLLSKLKCLMLYAHFIWEVYSWGLKYQNIWIQTLVNILEDLRHIFVGGGRGYLTIIHFCNQNNSCEMELLDFKIFPNYLEKLHGIVMH